MMHNNDMPVFWTEGMEVCGGPHLKVPIRAGTLGQVAVGKTRAVVEGPCSCYVGGGCTLLRVTIEALVGGEG